MLGRVTARSAVTLHALRGAGASHEELRVRLAQQQAVARISQLALTAGTGFIQKPFSSDDLANRVRELLDHVAA